jgi:hypothetical protein
MRFLDLEMEERQLDPARFGDQARARRLPFRLLGQPISDDRVGRWRVELSDAERRDFERAAREPLAAYGYLDEDAG